MLLELAWVLLLAACRASVSRTRGVGCSKVASGIARSSDAWLYDRIAIVIARVDVAGADGWEAGRGLWIGVSNRAASVAWSWTRH